ncbi:flagellar biosynthetic protein FliO [Massilia aurea]|uniref:flagellar biosynthetic protein FliO n=1 Tax=Massilia aurea TaxID=373040 RepID=UPI002162A86A|nr:flagellar biosynthetic protein FliO [Massilia aurea]MCS0706826.1 flagellar biosynthetic protein FliO [Massilia aurea]
MTARRAAASYFSTIAALLLAAPLALAQQAAPATDTTTSRPALPASDTTTGRPAAPAVPAPATVPTPATPPVAALPGDADVVAVPVQPAVPATTTVTTAPSTTTTAPAITPMRPPPQVALPASSGSGAAGLLQTIFALLLVLGLLIGLAWLLKRYGPKPGGGLANLRVVGALNIGGRERIMVVEVGDQWIVVGAAPGRVNALHTMPRQDVDLGAGTGAAQGGIPATRFADWLKNTMDKRNAS